MRALGLLEKVMDALCLGKLRQKQQTRFALSCTGNQPLNMAIKQPLSSLLPLGSSCSCPQLPEELVPPGSMSWGKNAERLGAPWPCRNHLLPWPQHRPRALCASAGRGFGLPLPTQGSLRGGVQRTQLCCKMNRSISLRGSSGSLPALRPGMGTGRGCTHPRSIAFSIVPTAEGTCLKVEPEIAQRCAASGLAGLQGLAGGQAPTAAVGTFQPAPAGAASAEMEMFWGRQSYFGADVAVLGQMQPRDCGSAPLSPQPWGLTGSK